jgi:hypothetical protein
VKLAGRSMLSHRVSWVEANGPIPDGLCVLHRCDNRACVRPEHLFLGTHLDNIRDMMAKGRGNKASGDGHWTMAKPERLARGDANGSRLHPESRPRGDANGRAKLTDADVLEIRARYAAGELQRELGRAFGVAQRTISSIVRMKMWQHVGTAA